MLVPVEVWQVRLRTAISVYFTLLFFKNVKNVFYIETRCKYLDWGTFVHGRCPRGQMSVYRVFVKQRIYINRTGQKYCMAN